MTESSVTVDVSRISEDVVENVCSACGQREAVRPDACLVAETRAFLSRHRHQGRADALAQAA